MPKGKKGVWYINGVKLTDEQRRSAIANNLTQRHVDCRVRKGMLLDEAVRKPLHFKKEVKAKIVAGIEVTIEQFETAERNGIKRNTLEERLKRNIPIEEAITRPVKGRGWNIDGQFITPEQTEEAKRNGLTYHALEHRIKKAKLPVEEAIKTPPHIRKDKRTSFKEKKKKKYPAKMIVGNREMIVSYWETKKEAAAEMERLKGL